MGRLPVVFFGLLLSTCVSQVFGASTNAANLSCGRFISESIVLPKGWKVLGSIGSKKLPLLNAGLAFGKVDETKGIIFNEEILDDWMVRADGSEQTLAEYDQGHQNLMLRCTYASGTGVDDSAKINLLVPLPDRPVSCRIVKKAGRTLSATCVVK